MRQPTQEEIAKLCVFEELEIYVKTGELPPDFHKRLNGLRHKSDERIFCQRFLKALRLGTRVTSKSKKEWKIQSIVLLAQYKSCRSCGYKSVVSRSLMIKRVHPYYGTTISSPLEGYDYSNIPIETYEMTQETLCNTCSKSKHSR